MIFFCGRCIANDIDKLQTNDDVYKFLVKKVNTDFKKYPPFSDIKTSDTSKYSRNKFFKVDLDNNGATDLLIYGFKGFFAVIDNGNDNYTIRYLDRGAFLSDEATLVSIDTSQHLTKIIVSQSERPKQKDTLVYKSGGFIEYNPDPLSDFHFEKLHITTNACFGTCPIFELTINKDRTATYHAIQYNDETGEFKGMIPENDFTELVALLKYINPDKLNTDYAVNWTDDQTAVTEISYNGKTKSIVDYGEIGTFGLSRLYAKLFSWRKTVEWTSDKEN